MRNNLSCYNFWLSFWMTWLSIIFLIVYPSSAQINIHFSYLEDKLAPSHIIDIVQDKVGYLWLLTSEGVYKFDGYITQKYDYCAQEIDVSNFHHLDKLYVDNTNKIWLISEENGLRFLENRTWKSYPSLIFNPSAFYQDSKGHYWVGTSSGNVFYGQNTTSIIKKIEPSGHIFDFIEDTEDNILIAGSEHIISINKENFSWKTIPVLSQNGQRMTAAFSKFARETNGRIWVGTSGKGLFFKNVEDDYFQQFYPFSDTTNILNSANIIDLTIDSQNQLWISTYQHQLVSVTFDKGILLPVDGLPSKFKSQIISCLWLDYYQVLWFGTTETSVGYTLNTSPIQQELFAPVITQINGKNQFNSSSTPPLVTLKDIDNNIHFNYSTFDFPDIQNNQYKYKLAGYDTDWSESSYLNAVSYTNLPYGNYKFQLMAANAEGKWSDRIDTFSFKVLPPWYLSKLALIIYGLLFLGLLLAIYAFYQRRTQLVAAYKNSQETIAQFNNKEGEIVQRFTNTIHEFRTPLTILQGLAKQLKGNFKEKQVITTNVNYLLQLTNQILTVEQFGFKQTLLHEENDDIIQFLSYLTSSFENIARDKNISLVFFSEEEIIQTKFDLGKLEIILNNLLSNALKFTPEHGKVVVFVKRLSSSKLEIQVKDSGIGIDKTVQEDIFQRYYQVETDKKSTGNGLGLAVVKELIELMKGSICVNSSLGKGATFSIQLPIVSDDSPTKEISLEEPPITSTIQDSQPNQPVILLIEDNQDFIFYLKKILGDHYHIIHAINGNEGLKMAYEVLPNLIISDVVLPKKDGFQLCQLLKNDSSTKHIPIIILTAKTEQKHKILGLKLGADAYLTKPFEEEELKIRIKKLLQVPATRLTTQTIDSNNIANPFIEKISELIQKNIDNEAYSVAELARDMMISRQHLNRKVKNHTNQTLTEFVRNYRLEIAKELLQKNKEMNVSEISRAVGFMSVSYFTRCFKKRYGNNPTFFK